MSGKNNDLSFLLKEPEKRVNSLVKKMTHSGETDLNKEDLAELKGICKASDDKLMIHVYKQCFKCLHKDHSQVRVTTAKLFDYLFQKSHIIRAKLLDDFDEFLELTLAISQRPKVKLKLPPPKKYANLLLELTAKLIHKWHAEFACGYEKLRYAYRYLKEHKLVDFGQFQVRTREQLIEQQKLVEKQDRILTRSIENRMRELEELKPEIEQLVAQIESYLDLLIPDTDNLLGQQQVETIEGQTETSNEILHRQHGVANTSQSFEIEFSPYMEIVQNPENKDIVQNLRELKQELVESKITKLVAIEKTLSKRADQFVRTLKEIIDLKSRSMGLILKLSDLRIVSESKTKTSASIDEAESESDVQSDFEEVEPKEDLESYIPKSLRYEYGLEPINPRELETSQNISLTDESFDVSHASTSANSDCFSSDYNSMVLSCNVRLESGKLCPRRDKFKCPFHGRIIPRDHNGDPIDENDRKAEELKAGKRVTVPDWQDPELLREIKAATGVDLTMPKRGQKRLQPKKNNLANTKTCDSTPKQRLERRLKKLLR